MPMTFQPQNRREFCRNVLGGAVAAMLWETSTYTRADETGRDHWVFLSDTHIFADPNEERHNTNPNKNFAAVREAVLKLDHKPQGIIVTGDFAALQGRSEDYRQIATQVFPYTENGIPVHVSFGNHDNIDNYYDVFKGMKKTVTPVVNKHITVLETPNANLFLLDSLYQTDIVSGLLSIQQLRWLEKELLARNDKPALLFAHHNLDNNSGTLMDREEFWNVVKSAKQVKAYIYGHTHVYQQSVRDNVHLINLPALGWEFQSGKEPLGWSDVEIAGSGIELTLHSIPSGHSKNGDTRKFTWLR